MLKFELESVQIMRTTAIPMIRGLVSAVLALHALATLQRMRAATSVHAEAIMEIKTFSPSDTSLPAD